MTDDKPKIEHAYCCRCLQVQPCKVTRTPDGWFWHCTVCGALADEEFDDYEG